MTQIVNFAINEWPLRVRFRLVCQADDAKEAERAAALMRERILTGEHQ